MSESINHVAIIYDRLMPLTDIDPGSPLPRDEQIAIIDYAVETLAGLLAVRVRECAFTEYVPARPESAELDALLQHGPFYEARNRALSTKVISQLEQTEGILTIAKAYVQATTAEVWRMCAEMLVDRTLASVRDEADAIFVEMKEDSE